MEWFGLLADLKSIRTRRDPEQIRVRGSGSGKDGKDGDRHSGYIDISPDLLAAIDYVAASGPNGIAINRQSRGGEGSLVRDGVDHR